MVLFDELNTLYLLIFFASLGNPTPANHNPKAPARLQDFIREERTKRSTISFASLLGKQLDAWKAILRTATSVKMEYNSVTSHQSYYRKTGGYMSAIVDFYSVKPTDVRYFESSQVFGRVGKIGKHRTIILQTDLENGVARSPTIRVFKTEDMFHQNPFAEIIMYISPSP